MEEKHGRGDHPGIAAALAMVEAFTSVGVQFFDITHTNIDQEKRGFRPRQSLGQTRGSIPPLVASSERRHNNLILRPHRPPAVLLVQLDDLAAPAIERLRPAAFLILETSPGNFQAWVAVDNPAQATDADFARRLRKGAGADPTASGATRVAGTFNFKRKYEPAFPLVAITAIQEGRIVTRHELEATGLVAAPEPARRPANTNTMGRAGRWPSYRICVEHAPKAHGADHPDISRADFTWCMTAIDWGHGVEETAARLMEESTKAQENGPQYALVTATNAAAAVERRRSAAPGP